jgi:hypothetical protein
MFRLPCAVLLAAVQNDYKELWAVLDFVAPGGQSVS